MCMRGRRDSNISLGSNRRGLEVNIDFLFGECVNARGLCGEFCRQCQIDR